MSDLRERIVSGGRVALGFGALGLVGAWAGSFTYLLVQYGMAGVDPKTAVDLVLAVVLLGPLEAAVVGAATFVVGALVYSVTVLDSLAELDADSDWVGLVVLLGSATFVGVVGVPTAVLVHVVWNWRTATTVVDQILVLVGELRFATVQMVVVGFLSPLVLLFVLLAAVLAVFLVLFVGARLSRLRRRWPT